MPGLLRGIARTAAVAGTATAVSNRVTRRQRGRWAAQQGYLGPQSQPLYSAQPQPQSQPQQSATRADDMADMLDQLKQLGELKSQGVITEAEFEEQKRRLLG
ncbi:SHOCT domain-containing protein [Streptomyces sp. CA-251387]|uniref:SHOCT domain-containing protein n=1 Tax=Streptomyces sp. CA-251387 TaxID=3240064 RepID=UPI003D8E3F53